MKSIQVFISYSFKDEGIMNKLLRHLKFYDINYYVSKHDENYGGSLSNKLTSAIDKSRAVIVILTKNGSLSSSVNQEIGYAKKAKKKIIPLLENGVSLPVFLQDSEYAEFTQDNLEEILQKISIFVATKIQDFKKSSDLSLKEIVEHEGVDLETDDIFTKFVLDIGRKYLIKKYGKLDISLRKEIIGLSLIGLGLLASAFALIFWSVNSHSIIESTTLYVGIGLAIPTAFIFSSIGIILKRKCSNCHKNFGMEMTESKQVEKSILYKTDDFVKIREINRNTYTCTFCDHQVVKNIPREYTEYSRSAF